MGIELRRPGFLAVVAEVCEEIGRPREGLSAVAEALAAAEHTGQRYWDAELHRLRGTLTLRAQARSAAPGPAVARDAESHFLRAIEIARRQHARSLELRAATSLSRLWASRRKPQAAHALLADVYAWFTEGLDTADLREARALLEELQRGATPRRAEKR
jgi:predicted ATPase